MKKRRRNLSSGSKKASTTLDGIMFVVLLSVFAVLSVIGYMAFDKINVEIQADSDINANAKEISQNLFNIYPALFDGLFVFFFGLMWILIVVASYSVRSHPVLFGFSLLMMVFVIFIGAEMSNMYQEFQADEELMTYADAFPMTNYLMGRMPYIVLLIVVSILVFTYGKVID